jgi:anti-sigma B factor antagonist
MTGPGEFSAIDDPGLSVTTSPYADDTLLVTAVGEADLRTAPLLRSSLFERGHQGGPNVILDLSGVTFIDSVALSTLVAARRYISAQSGELTLVYDGGPVARVLSITGLDTVFTTRPTLDRGH